MATPTSTEGKKLKGDHGSHETQQAGLTKPMHVQLERTAVAKPKDDKLWTAIRDSSELMSFKKYHAFIDAIMSGHDPDRAEYSIEEHRLRNLYPKRALPFPGVDAYRLLKVATEVFLMTHCGVNGFERILDEKRHRDPKLEEEPHDTKSIEQEIDGYYELLGASVVNGDGTPHEHRATDKALPYLALIHDKIGDAPLVDKVRDDKAQRCYFVLREKLKHPCMAELIWSYWHEEAMVAQSMNVILQRFQNRRVNGDADVLGRLDLDPLRPLANIIWGYLQDEQNRLTVVRRAYEYEHMYGFVLQGRAVKGVRPAETRSRFVEAFHDLLHRASIFYKSDDDTTMLADAFPVLNALKDVHFILAEGASNQFGDLPTAARGEMLMQLWLLARPEMREFVGGRTMMPYPEPWMDRVDNLKAMLNWTDTSVMHFHDLGVYGEQLLLSIRYGAWTRVDNAEDAAWWARAWRTAVFQYIHSYRAVTGVDLSADSATGIDGRPPSEHLQRRLEEQQAQRRLSPAR